MEFHYDSAVDILSIRRGRGPYVESEEVAPGIVLDFDRAHTVIGVEILNAVRRSNGRPLATFHNDAASLGRNEA